MIPKINPIIRKSFRQAFDELIRPNVPMILFEKGLFRQNKLVGDQIYSVSILEDTDFARSQFGKGFSTELEEGSGHGDNKVHLLFAIELTKQNQFFMTTVRCPKTKLKQVLPFSEARDYFVKQMEQMAKHGKSELCVLHHHGH